jgi:hypothetical protein
VLGLLGVADGLLDALDPGLVRGHAVPLSGGRRAGRRPTGDHLYRAASH